MHAILKPADGTPTDSFLHILRMYAATVIYIFIWSSILMCDQMGARVFAVINPLAAAAGTPIPG